MPGDRLLREGSLDFSLLHIIYKVPGNQEFCLAPSKTIIVGQVVIQK
jgi:hypothetical protein